MIIDSTTIIICSIIILTAIITPLINIFFRKPELRETVNEDNNRELPKLSVIITSDNNAHELKENLETILEQDYPEGFEVIIVVEKKEDDTDELLKSFKKRYTNLYTTFVPDSSRYMSRKKLAVTIGVKAAKNEWIVLTDAGCKPYTRLWLRTMARNCNGTNNLIIGYSNYNKESSLYQRFERLYNEMYLMREAQNGTAYRTCGNNLMFRKEDFMTGRGYEGNLKYLRGEYDFIVNKYSRKGNTATELSPDAWITEDAPFHRAWLNKHLYYMETRKHLQRTFRHRTPIYIDTLVMHANYIIIITAAVISIITSMWIITGAAFAALIISIVLRTIIGKKITKHFDTGIPTWRIVPLEICILWRNLYYRLKYKIADKYDFICHKL